MRHFLKQCVISEDPYRELGTKRDSRSSQGELESLRPLPPILAKAVKFSGARKNSEVPGVAGIDSIDFEDSEN